MGWVHWTGRRLLKAACWVWACSSTSGATSWRRTVAPPRRGDGSEQNLASLRGDDTDAAGGGDASSDSGGYAGGQVGSSTDTHTHTHTHSHTHGVFGWLLDRATEGWARVRSAFGDG